MCAKYAHRVCLPGMCEECGFFPFLQSRILLHGTVLSNYLCSMCCSAKLDICFGKVFPGPSLVSTQQLQGMAIKIIKLSPFGLRTLLQEEEGLLPPPHTLSFPHADTALGGGVIPCFCCSMCIEYPLWQFFSSHPLQLLCGCGEHEPNLGKLSPPL